MTLLHCLACDDLRALADGAGEGRCACGSSTAELGNGSVTVHGPVAWSGSTRRMWQRPSSARPSGRASRPTWCESRFHR